MPNFDGGHYFLTALLPIKTSEVFDQTGMRNSPVHMVRDALAILPTARQSPVTQDLPPSPFAKCMRTHFARFAVIDDVIFNGRNPTDTILDMSDRATPQSVDQLPCPYLMIVIDFDASSGTDEDLRGYLHDLWTKTEADLKPIFLHCFGYTEKATSADGFADYIISCQIETTVPFNDYWPGAPPLPTLSKGLIALAFFAPATIVWAGLYTAMGSLSLIAHKNSPWLYCAQIVTIVVLAITCGLFIVYRLVMARGKKSFPTAPNSDLPSILKALYLQRALIGFAIDTQGQSVVQLFNKFGDFLNRVDVSNTNAPTQTPGTIRP